MSAVSRGVIYSLVAVVFVLLLGIMALLGVAYNRHQRLEDATIDLQRNLTQQENEITKLQEQLEECDTIKTTIPADTSWSTRPAVTSEKDVSQAPSTKW